METIQRMGIDIVITLKKDRIQNYAELRYTLRSLETNLSGYRDIYIVGDLPNWITGVNHLPYPDIAGRKAYSIFRKIYHASNHVSERFMYSADDTYLLKPLHVSDIKDWYDNTIEHWTTLNINSMYRMIIKNTHKVFPDGLFYNVHTPCIYEKERFQALAKYPWSVKDFLIKSMYFNSGPSNPEPMKDPKRHRGLFYSTSRLKPEEERWLKILFPNPSRYEADNKTNAETASGMAKTTG